MHYSKKQLEELTKRELVRVFIGEIVAWGGTEALGRVVEHRLRDIADLLERCTLFAPERRALSLCERFLLEARRLPEPGLHAEWLQTMEAWLAYLDNDGFCADELPEPMA